MRQVDLDELTYQIFSGLRSWTPSVRKRVFAPIAKRQLVEIELACDRICASLRVWDFIDPDRPISPLTLKELAKVFAAATERFPGSIAGLWLSGVPDREREAHNAAAMLLTRSIDHLEVLSPTSLDHHGLRMVTFPTITAPDHAFLPRWP